ncbi:MAG: metal-sensing transcriptional repressor [Erysipelotrichaceae bacterium]|nr:metal-sensing transcriptional repressor [Erysipelotrichaceae bacterium]
MTDKAKIKKFINISRGQLEGIVKMLDDERDSLEISDQLMATRSLLKKANNMILGNHIEESIKDAIVYGDEDKVEKIMKALEKQI